MYIIIIGCGRVGSNLAIRFSAVGHNVVVIDADAANFHQLGNGCNCEAIAGMPIDEDVLREAGVENADVLIAVTPDDNMNLMTAQIARQLYHVPRVLIRTCEPRRNRVLKALGIDSVCTTSLVADHFFEAVTAEESAVPEQKRRIKA
jgi:trk system potassium uptake protein TrkA